MNEVGTGVEISPRLMAVLRYTADGLTSSETAEAMGISSKTVDVHRAKLKKISGARNAAHLIRWAIRNNLVIP